MKQILLLSFILASLLAVYYLAFGRSKEEMAAENPSVILTTFGERTNDGWSGEAAPYMDKLTSVLDISTQAPMCEKVFKGKIQGQPILFVITGTGKVQASACATNILQITDGNVKEIILSGIAGITPTKGGQGDGSENVMIGDVCINSHAIDFASQYYSSDSKGSATQIPTFWASDSANISTKTKGSIALAQELYDASFEVSWPVPTSAVAAINTTYHATSREPQAWGPGECLEASDDLFWHDAQSDLRARQMGAAWLEESLGYHATADNIIIATAMETAPVGTVVSRWNNAYESQIPFAYVRGASNFDQVWLDSEGLPGASGRASLETRLEEDGVAIASQTAALTVLKMLELRTK